MVAGAARLRGRAREALQSPYAPFILLGVLLRVVVLPFTAHLDAMLMLWQATDTVASGHLNPYDYAYQHYGPKIFNPLIWSPYGWAFYGTAGLWASLLRLSGLHSLTPWTWAWEVPLLPRAITLFKLLYALVEAATVLLLCRVTEDGKPRPLITVLWLLSPVTLYTSYVMGQNDLLPVACVVLSLWAGSHALRQERDTGWWAYLAVAALGLGGAYKLFPLACLPVAALLLRRTLRDRMALVVTGLVPFLLCTLPFIGSRSYRYSSLLNPEATGVLGIQLPWTSGIAVPAVVIAYACLVLYLYDYRPAPSLRVLCASYFAALLTLLVFQTPLPQWFMWPMPCLVLFCAAQPSLWKYVIVQSLFFALWISSLFNVSDLGLGLLTNATSTWFGAVPPLSLLIEPLYSFDHVLSAAYGLYLCTWLFITIALWRKRGTPLFGSRFVRTPHGIALLLPLLVMFVVLWANLLWGQRRIAVARSEQEGSTTKPLTPSQTVSQSFTIPATVLEPALSCIEVRLHTEHRFNMTPVQLAVAENSGGRILATAEATPSGTPIDTWQPFCFAPVSVQSGRSYLFTVRSLDSESAIAVVRGKKDQDSYPEGRSIVNGQDAPDGRDLTFRADIMLPWTNVWRDVTHHYAEDAILFVLHGFTCVVLGIALCTAVVMHLIMPRVPRRASTRIGTPVLSEDN